MNGPITGRSVPLAFNHINGKYGPCVVVVSPGTGRLSCSVTMVTKRPQLDGLVLTCRQEVVLTILNTHGAY